MLRRKKAVTLNYDKCNNQEKISLFLYCYEERNDSFFFFLVFGVIVMGEFKYLGTLSSVGGKLWIPLG